MLGTDHNRGIVAFSTPPFSRHDFHSAASTALSRTEFSSILPQQKTLENVFSRA
jgi:hypothetical protein